jgi:hypothetical protein
MSKSSKKYKIIKTSSKKEVCDIAELNHMNEQISKISKDGILHFIISLI